jgi:zinc transporter 1/2/3
LVFILKAFSAGVIIGVALLHLLAESVSELSGVTSYPLGLAMSMAGIVFTLGLDEITHYILARTTSGELSTGIKSTEAIQLSETSSAKHPDEMINDLENDSNRNKRDDEHAVVGRSADQDRALSKSLVLEVAIAVHSVIIGFGFGSLGPKDTSLIQVLIIALSFHQFFEAISLGTCVAESALTNVVVVILCVVFVITFPIGVAVGVCTSSSLSGNIVKSCANGFAAGMLLYASLVEMVSHDFSATSVRSNPTLKMQMYIALVTGCTSMAVLAIWA